MACNRDPAVIQTDVVTCTWHHWDFDVPAAQCLCAQDVKTRLAYVTRRKLHKAKREQQKKLQALEQRREVWMPATQGITSCQNSVNFAGVESCGAVLLLYSHVGVVLLQNCIAEIALGQGQVLCAY